MLHGEIGDRCRHAGYAVERTTLRAEETRCVAKQPQKLWIIISSGVFHVHHLIRLLDSRTMADRIMAHCVLCYYAITLEGGNEDPEAERSGI